MWKDSDTSIDFLDFDYLVNTLNDIIMNSELTPSTIGVYGDWGSGKSSLIRMSEEKLNQKENILCVKFNGWLFESYEDAKTALIGTILDEIKNKRTLTAKANEQINKLFKNIDFFKLASKGVKYGADFFLTGGIGTIAELSISSLKTIITDNFKEKMGDLKEAEIENILKEQFKGEEIRKNVKTFHKDFSELLEETKIDKLVVFIDELDRCNPNTIIETLEAIRLFLFAKNTSFVIGADERHVIYAVKRKFSEIQGNQIDIGKEYLEKLIQYPIRIPQLSRKEVEFYIMLLFFKLELEDDEFKEILKYIDELKKVDFINFEVSFELLKGKSTQIADKVKESIILSKSLSFTLASGMNGNPRHCKRFLNSLLMRLNMAKHRNVELNREVLGKLMLLEYFKSDAFKKIAEIQVKEEGLPSEIKKIENDNWEQIEDLKLWKDDGWFKDWIKLEPLLSGTDLRPYYYFSRESLAYQLNVSLKLSDLGREVLEKLLGKNESQRKSALKNANSINEFEANIILEKLQEKTLNNSSIDSEILKSLLEWGSSKELLFTSTIAFLESLSGNLIKFGQIPSIKAFMDKTKKESDITSIVKKWVEENPRLKQSVETQFKISI